MGKHTTFQDALINIERLIGFLFKVYNPLEFPSTLVKATAKIYKADIATIFRVNPSKTELVAQAGFDSEGKYLRLKVSYNLPWEYKKEEEMMGGGLTAWVALSGEPLFIKNYEELIKHSAHKGFWDSELHPKGPEKTFGCLYAVPLRIVHNGDREKRLSPKESVIGVYKIERRKDNKEGIFTSQQIKEFDFAAKQLTLTILLSENAMINILSDARHAVQGRLGDIINEFDIIKANIELFKRGKLNNIDEILHITQRAENDAKGIFSWLQQTLTTYMNPLETDSRKLSEFIEDTIWNREIKDLKVESEIFNNIKDIGLNLIKAQSYDLQTVLLCLLNNALEYSRKDAKLNVDAELDTNNSINKYTFSISDEGSGIDPNIIEESKKIALEQDSINIGRQRGTGLIRIFRIAALRDWDVDYSTTSKGTTFKIDVPIR